MKNNLNPLYEGFFGNLFNSPENYYCKNIWPKILPKLEAVIVNVLLFPEFKNFNYTRNKKDAKPNFLKLVDKEKKVYTCLACIDAHYTTKNSFVYSKSLQVSTDVKFDLNGHFKMSKIEVNLYSF